jgi:hypothetical protein
MHSIEIPDDPEALRELLFRQQERLDERSSLTDGQIVQSAGE